MLQDNGFICQDIHVGYDADLLMISAWLVITARGFDETKKDLPLIPDIPKVQTDCLEKEMTGRIYPFVVSGVEHDPEGIQITPHNSAFNNILLHIFTLPNQDKPGPN